MILKSIAVGDLQANCYILGDEQSKEGILIDPGDEPTRIESELKATGISLKAIILTHGHFDHTGAVNAFDIPVYLHKDDERFLRISLLGEDVIGNIDQLQFLNDGQKLNFGTLTLHIIHTPGHSPGGICLQVENILFSGDTLFAQGVGRTDLPGGSYQQLCSSLKHKLFILDEHTIVYPGHGPQTTIGEEKTGNFYL
ncbi:MAG: MBL fold metallo-hydrolase [PVC group bacterium]|nr:MBL fold metallo-hydrolase [PVC group bacterium]